MSAKEIKSNINEDKAVETPVLDVKIPPTGLDVTAVVADHGVETEAVIPNKLTLGRRMRGDSARSGGRGAGSSSGRSGQRSGRGESRERVKPEFDSKIIDIRRVTRVASGGRRYSFSVAVVAGDHKGRVGVGLGKGGDTALSVEKATREAKKNMIRVALTPQMTLPHAIEGKYASSVIKIFPARGSGIVAGSSARVVIEMAGIKDVCAKFLSGSKNRLNNAKAAIEALRSISKTSRAALHGRMQSVG